MPTTNARVGIEIYVDDQGTLRVREFADKTNKSLDDVANKSQSVTGRIRAGWGQVKAAWVGITASILAMREAWNVANMAAQAKQEEVAFANLAASYGTNSKAIIDSLKAASGQTIDTMTLIRNAGTAMMMGIAPDKVIELMKIARATAKMTGQSVTKAFGDISLAVGRQSRMILDNLGIIVDVEKANGEYAVSLGKTSSQLSDAEKKQAFMNATLKAGGELMDKLGDQTDTAADKMARWKTRWTNATMVVGKALLTIGMGVEAIFTAAGAGANKAIGAFVNLQAKAVGAAAKMPLVGRLLKPMADGLKEVADNAKGAADIGLKHMEETWDTMLALWKEGEPTADKVLKNLIGQKNAADGLAKAQKKLVDQQKKVVEDAKKKAKEQADATAEMYKEAGLGADKYFSDEASKLVEKAAKWEKAGGDQLAIESWLYNELGKLSEEAWGKGEAAAGQYLDSVQTQSRTLVEEFNELQQTAQEKLDAIAGQAQTLDGTDIGLTVSFDGSAAMLGLDQLIERLRSMQQVAVSAGSGQGGNNSQQTAAQQDSSVGNSTTTNNSSSVTLNVNQQVSRSDINAIISEQNRRQGRS